MNDEEIERLARKAGLLECIDDAYLARGDWLPEAGEFVSLLQSAERERCADELKKLQDHNAAIAVSLQEFLCRASVVVSFDGDKWLSDFGEEILKQLKEGPK